MQWLDIDSQNGGEWMAPRLQRGFNGLIKHSTILRGFEQYTGAVGISVRNRFQIQSGTYLLRLLKGKLRIEGLLGTFLRNFHEWNVCGYAII
jgi:hypothetical protein